MRVLDNAVFYCIVRECARANSVELTAIKSSGRVRSFLLACVAPSAAACSHTPSGQWLLDLMAEVVHRQHGPVAEDKTEDENGVKRGGTGISSREAATIISPLLINFVDFRLAVHGTDHTVLDGLSASDSVLDFVKVILCVCCAAPWCLRHLLGTEKECPSLSLLCPNLAFSSPPADFSARSSSRCAWRSCARGHTGRTSALAASC